MKTSTFFIILICVFMLTDNVYAQVFTGGQGRGDDRAELLSFVSVETDTEMPMDFMLFQNYPNPFNPTTKIAFQLVSNEHVVLEIFNTSGQKIGTLINSELSLGTHMVNFDASALASGVYIYRLKAGTYAKSKKMLIVK